VTICGVVAAIKSQTANSVTVILGAASNSGTGDIKLYSARGVTTFVNGYTYNPPGVISGPLGWSSISNLPAAKSSPGAVSVNGKIYAIGGFGDSTVLVYDPAQPTQGWLSLSNLPEPRDTFGAVSVNGKIYAIAGDSYIDSLNTLSSVDVYDPAQPSLGWVSVSNLPQPIQELGAVTVNGKIYAIGGDGGGFAYATVYVYDPTQPSLGWLSVSNLPTGVAGEAVATVNGKIYVIGGQNGGVPLSTVFVYDTAQPTRGWLSVSNLPGTSYALGAASLNGKIYAIGGDPGGPDWSQSTVYVYDPERPKLGWLSVSNLPQPLDTLAAVSVNGKIYVLGGDPSSAVYEGSFTSGVVPSSGQLAGGYKVAIRGNNLGNHDVTRVTLCGVPATILVDNSPTEIVVRARAAVIPTNGNVVVNSTSYGTTVRTNAYTYYLRLPTINTVKPLASGLVGIAYYQTLEANGGLAPYTWTIISGSLPPGLNLSTNGVISGTPVVATNASFIVQLTGSDGLSSSNLFSLIIAAESTNSGPASGGNTLTITGMGNGSDITNITVCGIAAVILSHTMNSVTVALGPGDGGTGDIVVSSASLGVTTFINGYTYNPRGAIFGPFMGWSTVTNLQTREENFGVTSLNGKIYVVGGNAGSGYLDSVNVYDTAQPTSGWSSVSGLPDLRWGPAAVTVNGKIYALGGANIYNPTRIFSTVWVYDPSQPALGWLSLSNLPTAGNNFPAASVNGKIYAIEGQSAVSVYDPAQPTLGWLSMSNLPTGSYVSTATSVNGKIYALGSGFYVYDPSQPAAGWLSLSNLSAGGAIVNLNGRIYAIGGHGTNAYVYDPSQPTLGWLSASNLPAANSYVAVANANGNIYALEGNNGNPPTLAPVFVGSFASGVAPSSGPLGGGNTVTISGNNLGNGDVTNVTLSGIPATILADYSPTQVVVTAGTAAIGTIGDVVVSSASYGTTIKTNAYTYLPLAVPGALPATNITVNSFYANWNSVSGATNYLLEVSSTSNFTVDVAGYTNLSVGNVATFLVNGLSAGTTYYYQVRFQLEGGTSGYSSTISVQTLGGLSLSNGPATGGNLLTIGGIGLGNGSDITNVIICGAVAAIQSQTANTVTVLVAPGSIGTGDVLVYSASSGPTIFVNGYTYTSPGVIIGPFSGWSSISNLPAALEQLAATSVNDKIYALAGYEYFSGVQSNVYVYDTTQPTLGWLSVSNLPTGLSGLAAATVNGKLYAMGGGSSAVYVYDPAQPAQGWLSVSNLPVPTDFLAAASVNGKLYVIGGEIQVGYARVPTSAVYVYDPAQPAQGWLSLSNLPTPIEMHAAVGVDGRIYAIGGEGNSGFQSTVYVYDPSRPAQGWLTLSNLPASTGFLAAAGVNGRIYAMGGYPSSVNVYDPSQPSLGWLSVSNLPLSVAELAGTSANGRIYALGGLDPFYSSAVYEGTFAPGVTPSSGQLAGGNTVTITGNYLGNQDVTNVTVCGIPATILADYSPTQIVVTAGTAVIPLSGDVVVDSTSYGTTVATNAYSYVSLAAPSATIGSKAYAYLPPPTITTAFDGTNLQLSWPTNCLGWELEAQTNPASAGLGTNWFLVTGSTATNQFLIPINPANGSVFYRLHQ
jgi:N-acetylneuraminic acid mutarotase